MLLYDDWEIKTLLPVSAGRGLLVVLSQTGVNLSPDSLTNIELRKSNGKAGTTSQAALDRDGAVHLFDGVLHDGKAQAGATHLTGAGLVDAVEALEDAREIFRRYAHAGIRDANLDAPFGYRRGLPRAPRHFRD